MSSRMRILSKATPRHVKRAGRIGRKVPPISIVPTLLTLGNLLCGFAAIHFAAKPIGITSIFEWNSLTVAGLLIFVGMFFDSIDGSIARLTKSTSDVGAMLDCLADIVTFGLAPAFMMLRLITHYYYGIAESQTIIVGPEADDLMAKFTWGIAAVFLCCAALRLARFQVETPSADLEDHRFFSGLPTPGAAGVVASLIVLHQHLLFKGTETVETMAFARGSALGIPLVTLACSFAMISRIRYTHLVNRYLAPKREFTWVARIVIPIVFASLWPQITLAVCFTAYALSGPIASLKGGGSDKTDDPTDLTDFNGE